MLRLSCLFILLALVACQSPEPTDKPPEVVTDQSISDHKLWQSAALRTEQSKPPQIVSVDKWFESDYGHVEFKFSVPMQRVSIDAIDIETTPSLPCVWYWTDERHLNCDINEGTGFQPATEFSIQVNKGLYSQDGIEFPPYQFQFESPRPLVDSYSVKWLSPTSPQIKVRFNLPVNQASLTDNLFLIDENEQTIALQVLPNPDADNATLSFDQNKIWILKPLDSLLPDSRYHFYQGEGITTPLGTLASLPKRISRDKTPIKTFGDFRFIGHYCRDGLPCPPERSISLNFSAPVNNAEIESCADSLAVAGVTVMSRRSYYNSDNKSIKLSAKFPRHTYRLTCLNSIKDVFGRPLENTVELTTGDFNAAHYSPYSSHAITSDEPLTLVHQSINYDRLTVTIDEVDYAPVDPGEDYATKVLIPSGAANELSDTNLIPEALADATSLKGRVSVIDKPWLRNKEFFVQKTNYNAIVQRSPEELLVFISDIHTNQPVSNIDFELVFIIGSSEGRQESQPIKAKTNEVGVAVIPYKFRRWREFQLLFTLANGERFAVHDGLRFGPDVLAGNDFHSAKDGSTVFWGITNKPMYRPGETVRYAGFVRKIQGTERLITALPENMVAYVDGYDIDCWRREDCNSFYINNEVSQNQFGVISGEFTLPSSVADGRYWIGIENREFDSDTFSQLVFTVANYKAQKLKVALTSNSEDLVTDQQLPVTVGAEYYSGGPYVGAFAEISLSMSGKNFGQGFKEYESFIFHPNNTTDVFDENNSYYFNAGALDEAGEASLTIALPSSGINYGYADVLASVTTDEAENIYSQVVQVPFSRKSYYVGLYKLDRWLETNSPIRLDARVVSLQGVEQTDVEVRFYSQKATSFWGAFRSDGRRYNDEEQHPRIQLACNPSAVKTTENQTTCTFENPLSGYYHLIAEIEYPDGSTQWSSSTHYFSDTSSRDESSLVISTEKDHLVIGERAEINLQHGLREASAFIVIHREETLDYWWQPLQQGLNQIRFDVKERFAPGFDVTVFVNYGNLAELRQLPDSEYAQVISQRFTVETPELEPIATITAPLTSFKPGETISLTLDNHADKSAQVILAIVDQSIIDQAEDSEYYKLTDTDLGDWPLSWKQPDYYQLSSSLYSAKYQEMDYEAQRERIQVTGSRIERQDLVVLSSNEAGPLPERPISGMNLNSQSQLASHYKIRQLFADAAYWNSNITIDANSSEPITLTLPDNLTTWKIIALSTTRDGNIYVDDENITASLPLEVHGQSPGQLTIGDRFAYQSEVIAKDPAIDSISLLSAAQFAQDGSELVSQKVEQYDDVQVYKRNKIALDVVVEQEGTLELLTAADAGIAQDALLLSSPVYSQNVTRSHTYYSLLPEETFVAIEKPADAVTDTANIAFNLSGSVTANLQGTFDYMQTYPHQCWEQKLSRAVVASIDLATGVNSDTDRAILNGHIQDATRSITKFQADNGGMSFFGNSEYSVSVFLSAYTFRNIQYLQTKGISFPKVNSRKLRRYLLEALENEHSIIALEEAVMIVNALASEPRTREEVKPYLSRLMNRINWLDVFSHSQLLETLSFYENFNAEKQTLITLLLENSRVTDKKRLLVSEQDMPWYLFSYGAKNYCSVITSLTKHETDKKVVNQFINAVLELRRLSKGDFGNTVSNAHCAVALEEYARRYENDALSDQYRLAVQDQGFDLNSVTTHQQSTVALDQPLTVKIDAQDSGTAYLQTTVEYEINAMAAEPVANGFSITRQYFQYQDNAWVPVQQNQLQQGALVKVRLQVNNPLFRRFVAVTDTLPGTFFALDENLTTSAPAELFETLEHDYYFAEKQFGPRHTKFYADILPPGEHVIEYMVKVTHLGEFSALPAKIEEMYDDDVYATSAPKRVTVH